MSSLAPPAEEGARGGVRLAPSMLYGDVVPRPLITCGVGLSIFVRREGMRQKEQASFTLKVELKGICMTFLEQFGFVESPWYST